MRHNAANRLVLDYLDGELAGRRLEAFERHLEACEACRVELDRLEAARHAASFLKVKEEPSPALDRAILHESRIAATRRRAQTREAEGTRRVTFWRAFRPAALTTVLVALLIGLAVFYLPQERALRESVSPTTQITPPAEPSPAPGEATELEGLKTLEFMADSEDVSVRETPMPTGGLVIDVNAKKQCIPGQPAEDRLDVVDRSPKLEEEPAAQPEAPAALPEPPSEPPKTIPSTPVPKPRVSSRVITGPAPSPPAPAVRAESRAIGGAEARSAPVVPEDVLESGVEDIAMPRKQPPPPRAPSSTPEEGEISFEEDPADDVEERTGKKDSTREAANLFNKARRLELRRKWTEAGRLYEKLLADYPNYRRQEVLYRLGKTHSKRKNYSRAQKYYNRLKKEYPSQKLLSEKEYRRTRPRPAATSVDE